MSKKKITTLSLSVETINKMEFLKKTTSSTTRSQLIEKLINEKYKSVKNVLDFKEK